MPTGLDLVTFPQVASQRGVAQPVHEVLAAGAPLLLDVAFGTLLFRRLRGATDDVVDELARLIAPGSSARIGRRRT